MCTHGQGTWHFIPWPSLCSPLGQKPRVSESDFEDLLSDQGFSSKSDRKGPRTMAEMRRQEQARDTDPLKLKVRAVWVPRGCRWGGSRAPDVIGLHPEPAGSPLVRPPTLGCRRVFGPTCLQRWQLPFRPV